MWDKIVILQLKGKDIQEEGAKSNVSTLHVISSAGKFRKESVELTSQGINEFNSVEIPRLF